MDRSERIAVLDWLQRGTPLDQLGRRTCCRGFPGRRGGMGEVVRRSDFAREKL
jgi:hypothetical protein